MFKLTTLVVIGSDYIGSCKSNYHTIMTAPLFLDELELFNHLCGCWYIFKLNIFDLLFFYSFNVASRCSGSSHLNIWNLHDNLPNKYQHTKGTRPVEVKPSSLLEYTKTSVDYINLGSCGGEIFQFFSNLKIAYIVVNVVCYRTFIVFSSSYK